MQIYVLYVNNQAVIGDGHYFVQKLNMPCPITLRHLSELMQCTQFFNLIFSLYKNIDDLNITLIVLRICALQEVTLILLLMNQHHLIHGLFNLNRLSINIPKIGITFFLRQFCIFLFVCGSFLSSIFFGKLVTYTSYPLPMLLIVQ